MRSGPGWFRRHDPDGYALRRALRAAIVIPLATAVGNNLIGGAQVSLLAVFGSFALLVYSDFPGNRAARATAYAGLSIVGCVLITLGTLVSRTAWLAVATMFAIGVLVLFAGVFSAALAAGGRAALLTFVLPVATPAPPGAVGDRLLGWAVAVVLCVPAALFLFPPRQHDRLRDGAAATCAALGDVLDGRGAAVAARTAMAGLQHSFLAATTRPVGLSAGSRALVRVVDDLQWLTDRIAGSAPVRSGTPDAAARVLRDAAAVLRDRRAEYRRVELDTAVADLDAARDRGFAESAALSAHAVDSTVAITGRVVSWSARAEARSPIDRVLGRHLGLDTYTAGYLRADSVSLQNSVRGGLGLAIAVAITQIFPVHHGFWIVLGTLSVLRSSALSTGSTVLRAAVGTIVGFVAGAALIVAVGTGPAVLWLLFPVATFLAAFVPEVISFAAGQAAFTVTVLILFNLLQPTGWRVGLVRVEDVAVGCLAAVIVAVLLWPRGVAAGVARAIATANRACAEYLRAAVHRVTRHGGEVTTPATAAIAASRTLDDITREYLSERGDRPERMGPVLGAVHRATRLRLSAEAIGRIVVSTPYEQYPQARAVLERHADAVAAWFDATPSDAPPPRGVGADLATALGADARPRDLLWTAAYLNELEMLRRDVDPA